MFKTNRMLDWRPEMIHLEWYKFPIAFHDWFGDKNWQLLVDTQLIGLILVLLLLDTLVIGLWVTLDPLERHLHNLTMVVSSLDRSVVYQPQVLSSLLFTLTWAISVACLMQWHVIVPVLDGTSHFPLYDQSNLSRLNLSKCSAVKVTSSWVVD